MAKGGMAGGGGKEGAWLKRGHGRACPQFSSWHVYAPACGISSTWPPPPPLQKKICVNVFPSVSMTGNILNKCT